MPCNVGIDLLAARDKALGAIRGFKLGMIVGSKITPEMKAEEEAHQHACNQVGDPAYSYNEHVKVCTVCK